jgi:acyl carrier protein
MTTLEQPVERWLELADALAAIAQLPVDEISPSARLIEDLDLDSLALAELVVFAAERAERATASDQFEGRRWDGVTLAQFYTECYGHPPPAAG